MSNIGDIIKDLRIEKGISQEEFAKKIGVKQSTVSNYERGTKRPSYEVLIAIADFFNETTDYLLGREQ